MEGKIARFSDFSGVSADGRTVSLNELELSAFQELIWNGRLFSVFIYMHSLRLKMNWKTGVTGLYDRISYKELDEVVERRPSRGSKLPPKKRTRRKLRYDLECLKDVGLVEPVLDADGKALPLVFLLPLASLESIRSNEERHLERHTCKIINLEKSKPYSDSSSDERHDERHTSFNKKTNTDFLFLKSVVDLYHRAFPSAPPVKLIGPDLQRAFAGLLVLSEEFSVLKFWEWYFFQVVPKNNFLSGREFRDAPFKISFYGLITPKIIEGVLNGKIR